MVSGTRSSSFAEQLATLIWDRLAHCRRPSFPDRRDCERRGRIARADRDRGARRCRGDCVCRCVHGLTGTRVNRHASGRGRVAADADRLGSAAGATRLCIWMRAPARSVPTRACASGVYMTIGPTRVGRPVSFGGSERLCGRSCRLAVKTVGCEAGLSKLKVPRDKSVKKRAWLRHEDAVGSRINR